MRTRRTCELFPPAFDLIPLHIVCFLSDLVISFCTSPAKRLAQRWPLRGYRLFHRFKTGQVAIGKIRTLKCRYCSTDRSLSVMAATGPRGAKDPNVDVEGILGELRKELDAIEAAILSLERQYRPANLRPDGRFDCSTRSRTKGENGFHRNAEPEQIS